MTFSLDQVVPWGRTCDEYVRMFRLTSHDLQRTILGCADGPASFNTSWTEQGGNVISCDPLYAFSSYEIRSRIDECFPQVLTQATNNRDQFVWSETIPDPEALGALRRSAMDGFLANFEIGKEQGRYQAHGLPRLPYRDDEFDLALCSHFLLLYDSLGEDFHLQSLRELCRVACEVRIFPLRSLAGQRPSFLSRIVQQLNEEGIHSRIETVDYEFQRGANEMLCLERAKGMRSKS